MAKLSEVLKGIHKDFGDDTTSVASASTDTTRIPTGIFPLDLITGGGFPRGKLSIVYGMESSSKTNITLKSIANHQKQYPDLLCVFADLENSFDPVWAGKLGVDTDRLILLHPSYGEQAVDMIEGVLLADDVGMVVIDSIAALVTFNETQSSADKMVVGGASQVVGKLVRKTTLAMLAQRRRGYLPTLIMINQVRMKTGVMFGNPEVMPGGFAPIFASAMTLRLYGKNVVDKKVSALPCRKHSTVTIKKHKVPCTAVNGEFELAMIPHEGLAVGECKDINTIVSYLKEYNWLVKEGKVWKLFDIEYPTIKAAMGMAYSDYNTLQDIKSRIIQHTVDITNG